MMLVWRRQHAPGERALALALVPWERRLLRESVSRWLIRGTIAACLLAIGVLLIGWVIPQPEAELRPWAVELAAVPIVLSAVVGAWPRKRLHRAADLDTRLRFGDRLATAWTYRKSEQPIMQLQRDDTIARLVERVPRTELTWRPAQPELLVLGAAAFATLVLFVAPSPLQAVLDRQAAELLAVEQASQRLDALGEEALAGSGLTAEQLQQLTELIRQTRAELNRTQTQQDAAAVLARLNDQVSQMGDPNADLRDEALAAMSETLAAEPRTRALGAALQHEDPRATSDALQSLSAQADQLSDIERQALSRALQRAANVGRADPRAAAALRDAAQTIASGNSASASLSALDAALRESIQSSQAQASLNATAQRLRELQARLASGTPLRGTGSDSEGERSAANSSGIEVVSGTPVALNSAGSIGVRDPATGQGSGAGVSGAGTALQGPAGASRQTAAENVFVPGRASDGPADQDLVEQPFTLRGAPRPFRDVLSQYAQTSRDYVDRPDISPAVRDLVKQYFQSLEEGQ